MEKNWKQWAVECDDNEWPFSSAFSWEKAVEANPNAFNLLQFADQLRHCGHYAKAEEIIDKINVEDIPSDYRFSYYVKKGLLFQDQGKTENAIGEFKKSIEAGTDQTYPYIFLAVQLSMKGRLDEAEYALLQALDKEGDIDEAYYNLSTTYARKGNFEKAITAMQECLKLDPNYSNAKTFLEDFKNMENIKGFQNEAL